MTDELTLTEAQRRALAPWAADCAERVLHVFEGHAPDDTRPREAIEGLRAFGRGERTVEEVSALSVAAHEAARHTEDASARAAARAAGHVAAIAHTGSHARGVIYAAKAADDPEQELEWQLEHASAEVREILDGLPMPRTGTTLIGRFGAKLSAR